MTNDVFEAGRTFAQALREAGAVVLSTEGSTNRLGQHSFYIQLASHRIRISDHDCNEAFRPFEQSLPYNELPSAADYLGRVAAAAEAARDDRQARKAADAEREALTRYIVANIPTAKGGRYTREKLSIMPADQRAKLYDRARAALSE